MKHSNKCSRKGLVFARVKGCLEQIMKTISPIYMFLGDGFVSRVIK